MTMWILASLGAGALVLAVVSFLSKPGEASVRYKHFEFRGPVAFAVLGVGLLCLAAFQSKHQTEDILQPDDRGTIGNSPPSRPLSGAETIAVPYYGDLEIGGSCRGQQHRLTGTWNCDAHRTKRVHCQNGMVVVEACAEGCVQYANGVDDVCR